jgi:hypothetical protein
MLPGMNQLPGVGGFTDSLMGMGNGMLGGKASGNPSYEQQFGPNGSISGQMRPWEQGMGQGRTIPGSGYGAQPQGGRPPWMA